jgi:hypothetical protein
MRIRSVKPEYWRSADTAVLDIFTRLLFIGLWNYVDDNGVGEDDVHLIRSDLFPRDRNVDELSERIHGSLTELSTRGQILRYTHLDTGRDYFKVEAWQHQKISHPTASKKPLPTSDNIKLKEGSVNPPGILSESSGSDLGIKGSRDLGNKGSIQPRKRASRTKPKTHIPDDFLPAPKTIQSIRAEFPQAVSDDFEYQTRKFRDHWAKVGTPMADWDATWRNWIRTANERDELCRRGRPGNGSAVDDKVNGWLEMASTSTVRELE